MTWSRQHTYKTFYFNQDRRSESYCFYPVCHSVIQSFWNINLVTLYIVATAHIVVGDILCRYLLFTLSSKSISVSFSKANRSTMRAVNCDTNCRRQQHMQSTLRHSSNKASLILVTRCYVLHFHHFGNISIEILHIKKEPFKNNNIQKREFPACLKNFWIRL